MDQFDQLQVFYEKIANSLEIFDPLDRGIPSDENNMAIKREEFLKKINDMPKISASKLLPPISNDLNLMLQNMFQEQQIECNRVAQNFLEKAKDNPKIPEIEFTKDTYIK